MTMIQSSAVTAQARDMKKSLDITLATLPSTAYGVEGSSSSSLESLGDNSATDQSEAYDNFDEGNCVEEEGDSDSGDESMGDSEDCSTEFDESDEDMDTTESSYDGTDDYTQSSTGMSSRATGSDDDWSSDDEDEYAELMATMPIALGRRGGPVPPPALTTPRPPLPPPPEGLPTLPLAASLGGSTLENPLQGLAALQSIRAELEQVGRMIVAQKDGEKFLKRAQILASINFLAPNVPSCVLDHLGQEIRSNLPDKDTPRDDGDTFKYPVKRVHVVPDDSSEGSDLSEGASMSDDEDEVQWCEDWMGNGVHSVQNSTRGNVISVHWNPGDKKECGNVVTNLPAVSYFQCALLFVDISGFTKLSTMLDPENLSKVINSYFQKIVDKVFEFGGDIQKFAGDALFAEWRASRTRPLTQCVEDAAACASEMVDECADFPVMAFGGVFSAFESQGSTLTTLNIHCGLGVGEMAGIHIGDNELRREYIYLGDPIKQATEACITASLGECAISPRFKEMLSSTKVLRGFTGVGQRENLLLIAKRSACSDLADMAQVQRTTKTRVRNAKSRGITDHVDGLQIDALIEYRRLMSLYVHPVVVSNDVAASHNFETVRASTISRERQCEDAELRSVYCMFIHPLVEVKLTGDVRFDAKASQTLNSIMNLISRELKRFCGHLRQFIVDDKGLILIATFGLRGSSFPNLVSERGLPATIVIYNALQKELNIESRIGASFGDVYCGAVGGEKRNEYAVMGPSVNLAARLMVSNDNPGILVDDAVRKLASRSYDFRALTPVAAKGYKEPVPIFQPLCSLNRGWGRIEANFVGRRSEMNALIQMAREMSRMPSAESRFILVSGDSGMGKSAMLAYSIENIRRTLARSFRSRMFIAKHVSTESDELAPFSTFRSILQKALTNFCRNSDDGTFTFASQFSRHSAWSQHSLGLDSATCHTAASSTVLSPVESADVFEALCNELGVAEVLVDFTKDLLFNDNTRVIKKTKVMPPRWAVVSFLAKIFRRCVAEDRLVILAVDDIHYADETSWHIFREIFDTAENILMIGTCSSSKIHSIRIDDQFWNNLNGKFRDCGRFLDIELSCLSLDEIGEMARKTLGLTNSTISGEVVKEVAVQSGGMPRFANEILQGMKFRSTPGLGDSDAVDDSVAQIILHRIDSLDLTVRNVLNIGAILGACFVVKDVLSVLIASSDKGKENELRDEALAALNSAIKEGILSMNMDEEKSYIEIENESVTLAFSHNVWQNTLLKLMLDSRKRDVHRKIAHTLEAQMHAQDAPIFLKSKLFSHWRASADTARATEAALILGKSLENEFNNAEESNTVYEDTLRMWNYDSFCEGAIAGFSSEVLACISPSDLENILRLMSAKARALSMLNRYNESIGAYEAVLKISQVAKSAPYLKDRSVIFSAFVGISDAIECGHIAQDMYCRYEQAMVRRFLQETRSHGRLIHHIHALYLQICLYSRQGDIEKAVAVQSLIKKMYNPDRHSRTLRKVYGKDSGALSFSLVSFWQMLLGENRQALKTCRYIFKELLPKIENDARQSFELIYPLVFVLKESGNVQQAKGFFEKVVIIPFRDAAKTNTLVPELEIGRALNILLTLSDKVEPDKETLRFCFNWASDPKHMTVSEIANKKLARLGRCGGSIFAEICLYLARYMEDDRDQYFMIMKGNKHASKALTFNHKHGFGAAQKQVHTLMTKLRMMSLEPIRD